MRTVHHMVAVESREAACARRWGLRLGPALAGGYRSHVRDCVTTSGLPAVLKLTVTADEAWLESAALTCWRNTGAVVRTLDYDPDNGALLLERLQPGTPLPGGDEPRLLDIVVDLLGRLHAITWEGSFPDLAAVYPRLAQDSIDDNRYERDTRREPDRAAGARNLMDAAGRAVHDLCSTATSTRLLHGDFLDKNLLLHSGRYVAVDPIPRVGEPESEIGFFAAHHPPVAGVFLRARTIAARLGADPDRAIRWAAIWMVLLATSAWREDQREMDALVGSAQFAALLAGS